MFKPLPLKITCDGLSKKLIHELADRLALYFVQIEICGDIIFAAQPLSNQHYHVAWLTIDRFGVKAA